MILPGAIDTEIWDQPDNDAPLYDGPKESPESIAGAIVDAIDSDRFEHYLPDMKGVIEFKTSDIDGFMLGMRALTGGSTAEGPAREGIALWRASAEDEIRPTPADELEAMLAGIPFGLHDVDDARLVRPDWVVTRPDPLGHLRLRRQARAGRLQHRATSTTLWPPSRRSPTSRGTRWSPR